MSERMAEFRIGALMLSGAALLIILLAMFSNDARNPFRSANTIKIRFSSAPGVSNGTPVRKLGILVGRVSDVAFAEDGQSVIVTAELDPDRTIRSNEACRINTNFLGDAQLEFVPGSQPGPTSILPSGSEIQGQLRNDPLQFLEQIMSPASDFNQTVSSIKQTSDEIGALAENINQLVGKDKEDFGELVRSARSAIQNIDAAAQRMNLILQDEELVDGLQEAGKKLPDTLTAFIDTLRSIEGAGDEARGSLEGVREIINKVKERSPTLVDDVSGAVTRIDDLVDEVGQLVKAANRPGSPIKRFLEDDKIYEDFSASVQGIRATIGKVYTAVGQFSEIVQKTNTETDIWFPKINYILSSVSELTGKLSQEPSNLLKGAARRPTPVTGTSLEKTGVRR